MPRSTSPKGNGGRRKPKFSASNGLTELERVVLGMMAAGKSNDEILADLFFSDSRLRQIKGRLRYKMGLDPGTPSVQIVQRARQFGHIE